MQIFWRGAFPLHLRIFPQTSLSRNNPEYNTWVWTHHCEGHIKTLNSISQGICNLNLNGINGTDLNYYRLPTIVFLSWGRSSCTLIELCLWPWWCWLQQIENIHWFRLMPVFTRDHLWLTSHNHWKIQYFISNISECARYEIHLLNNLRSKIRTCFMIQIKCIIFWWLFYLCHKLSLYDIDT